MLSGSNLVPQGGIGAFVARRLGEGLDIRLATPATRVAWNGAGVAVETPRGTVTARSAIVTVSTGVLAAGAIAFDPPLPPATQAAIQALPMGLAMKVALRATGPDRLDLPLHCSVDRQVQRSGDPTMGFQCWPYKRDYVQGWVGGPVAWELARAGEAAAVDFALGQLRALFGGRVDRLFGGGSTWSRAGTPIRWCVGPIRSSGRAMPMRAWRSPNRWPTAACCSPARPATTAWPARSPARGSADRMRPALRHDIVAVRRNQAMTIQALGYLGIGTDKLDDWTDYATNWLGMQPVDRGAGVRAFRMDDRKQRLVIDRLAARGAALFRLGGRGRGGARRAGGAAGGGRRRGDARTGRTRRSALRRRPDFVRRSGRQPAGGIPRRADRRRAVPPRPRHFGLPHRAAGHGPCAC